MLDQPEFGIDCTQFASITICIIVLIFNSKIFFLVFRTRKKNVEKKFATMI